LSPLNGRKLSIPVILTINCGNKQGDFDKKVVINTNDTNKPEISVSISGIALGEARALPPVVFFGETRPNNQTIRQSTITSTNGNSLEITKVESKSIYISTEVKQIEKGKKYTLITKMFSPEPNKTIRDSLRVYAEGKSEPILEIPVYARIIGEND